MTGADDGENARPGELSPRAAAALDRLSTVEAELREQLGPRRAHSAIVVTALLSTRLGADRLGDLAYHATPTDVFRDLDADVERALSAFDAQSVFNELYKTGHLNRTVGDVAAVIRSLSDSDQLMLAGELLKRTADPFVGMFTVPAEIAVLASRLTVGATENGEAHDRLYKRELRVFDPRAGCGEMLLELAHLIENHQGRAWVVGCEPSAEALGIAQASIALAGYSTSDLHQEEWLLRTASHEQAFDYLVSAIPATSWRHLDRWLEYGLSLPARPRSTDSSLLYVAKVAQRVSELPNSRAVLVVNSAALTTGAAGSGDVQLRRMIVELGALRAVIALPSGIFERTTVAPTMLLFTGSMDSRAKSSSSFRLVDARMYGARVDRKRRILGAADVDEIVMAVAQGGSENAVEIDIQVLAEDGRWRIPPFGKRISAKKGHSSSQDSAPTLDEHELGELCRVMSGRNRVAKETDRDPDLRVIRAEDVGVELRPWADLPYSTRRRKSSVEVVPGDIVGSISRPYGRWVLVPDGYGRALASDHTVVLRKQRDVSMWYILSFLRSERGKRWIESTFRGTVPRIARDELALIPVPDCPIESIEIDMILRDYESELIRLESEVGQLRSRLSAIHDTESPVETAANVDSLYGIVASVRSVGSLEDSLRIAENAFPYPIARTLRAIDRSPSPRAKYHEIVHEGLETVSTTLASLCAAVARDHSISGRAIKSWADSVRRNGATIGSQFAMALEVASSVSNDLQSDIGGLGQAFGDANSPAVALFGSLPEERNRIHGDYPKSDFQFRQRLGEAEGILRELLDSLSFLARWEIRYSESIEPIEGDNGKPDFYGTFRILRGDNSDWDLVEQISSSPLYRGRAYALVDGHILLDLHPYLVVRDCPVCGALEVYYPNSFGEGEANLKSIDRGHPQVCSDDGILRQLRSAFTSL